MARRRSALASYRRTLYTTARVLGDVRAVQTGRVPQRVVNKGIGRFMSRLWR